METPGLPSWPANHSVDLSQRLDVDVDVDVAIANSV